MLFGDSINKRNKHAMLKSLHTIGNLVDNQIVNGAQATAGVDRVRDLGQLVALKESGDCLLDNDLLVDRHVRGIAITAILAHVIAAPIAHVVLGILLGDHLSTERTLLHTELLGIQFVSTTPSAPDGDWGGIHMLGVEVLDELEGIVEEVPLGAITLASRGLVDFLVQSMAADAVHLRTTNLVDVRDTSQSLRRLHHLIVDLQMHESRCVGIQLDGLVQVIARTAVEVMSDYVKSQLAGRLESVQSDVIVERLLRTEVHLVTQSATENRDLGHSVRLVSLWLVSLY